MFGPSKCARCAGAQPKPPCHANITSRQEVGGSSIEASKIAGHDNTKITEEYTIVQMRRQEELTRRIQDKGEDREKSQGSEGRGNREGRRRPSERRESPGPRPRSSPS